MLRRALAIACGLPVAVPAALAAEPPRIDTAVGLSRTTVRVSFAAPVASGALEASDLSLSMGGIARHVTALAFAGDRRSATLKSATAWPYGTAGTVALPRAATVRVWASPGDMTAPRLTRVRLDRRVLCTRAVSADCARSGGTVRFRVDEPVTIVLDLRKLGSSAPSTARYPARAGRGAVSFHEKVEGLRLRPGRFVLAVTAVDAAGNESRTASLGFRVRR